MIGFGGKFRKQVIHRDNLSGKPVEKKVVKQPEPAKEEVDKVTSYTTASGKKVIIRTLK